MSVGDEDGAVESVNANTPAPDVPIAPAEVPIMRFPALVVGALLDAAATRKLLAPVPTIAVFVAEGHVTAYAEPDDVRLPELPLAAQTFPKLAV